MASTHDQRVAEFVRSLDVPASRIADLLNLGRVPLYDRMSGRTRWTVDEVMALAEAFRVSTDDILYGVDVETHAGATR